jgi:DNA transformation protein
VAKSEDSFHAFVRELFAGVGPVTVRRMFGGAGGYADGVMFLLLDSDAIYIKANDEKIQAELKREGSEPFLWEPESGPRKGEKVSLGYWKLPDDALDDPDLATHWGRKALALAKAKAVGKKPKKKAAAKSPPAKKKR